MRYIMWRFYYTGSRYVFFQRTNLFRNVSCFAYGVVQYLQMLTEDVNMRILICQFIEVRCYCINYMRLKHTHGRKQPYTLHVLQVCEWMTTDHTVDLRICCLDIWYTVHWYAHLMTFLDVLGVCHITGNWFCSTPIFARIYYDHIQFARIVIIITCLIMENHYYLLRGEWGKYNLPPLL